MSWFQRYGDGIKATVVAVGITAGIGAWTYCNMDHIGRNSAITAGQNTRHGRKKALAKKQAVGVLIDSSLEDRVREDFALALADVSESYRKYVNIDYSFEFKVVEMPGLNIEESDLYNLVPCSFKDKDHNLLITNSSVTLKDNPDDDFLGFYRYEKSTAVVHRAYLHQRDALYNIIAHELAHGQLMYHHVSDNNCIMYATMDSITKKEFCDEMIRFMTRKK